VACVYVRFLTMKADALVSDEILRDLFGYYGSVFDCAIKKIRRDPVRAFRVLHSFRVPGISQTARYLNI
jgi:hypothetical protein